MSEPKDKILYRKIEKQIYIKHKEHSAYRSGMVVKKYKSEYLKKHNSTDAYKGKKKTEGLTKWFSKNI